MLKGTSATLNVFNITASTFGDTNHPLDIVVPQGSTTVINVSGLAPALGTGIYINGVQYSGDSQAGGGILFNFPDATSVTIDGQLNASVLAPFALLTGGSQMGGNFIAAQIGQTGEVHNDEFTGNLPKPLTPAPEPSTLLLLGTGLLSAAGTLYRRKRDTSEDA